MNIAFHDRDGHIIRPYPEDVPNYENLTPFERCAPWHILKPERQQILPGVADLLKQFDLNFVVSNQKLRDKNKLQIHKEAVWLLAKLPDLDGFVFCPDEGETAYLILADRHDRHRSSHKLHEMFPDLVGTFRKPNTGMVDAILKYFPGASDASSRLGFGDRLTDKHCFEKVGCKFEWSDIARGYPDPTTREMS